MVLHLHLLELGLVPLLLMLHLLLVPYSCVLELLKLLAKVAHLLKVLRDDVNAGLDCHVVLVFNLLPPVLHLVDLSTEVPVVLLHQYRGILRLLLGLNQVP